MTSRPDPFATAAAATNAAAPAPQGTELPLPLDLAAHTTLTAWLKSHKEATAALKRHQGIERALLRYLLRALMEEWLRSGHQPPPPYRARNSLGQSCRLVLLDHSATAVVDEQWLARLRKLVDGDVEHLIATATAYDFNPVALKRPGVLAKVRAALMDSELTDDELAELLMVRLDRRLKSQFLERLVETIGPTRLARVLPALAPVVEVTCQP